MKCRIPALESLVLAFRNGGFHHTGIDGFHGRTGGVKPSGILIPSFRREDTANPVDKIPQFREWSTIIPELDTADFLNLYTVFMRLTA